MSLPSPGQMVTWRHAPRRRARVLRVVEYRDGRPPRIELVGMSGLFALSSFVETQPDVPAPKPWAGPVVVEPELFDL